MFYLASSTATLCVIHVIPVSVQTIRASRLYASSNHFLARATEADDDFIWALNPESHFLWCMCMYSLFARLGTDYEIRNQWCFAILEAMTTD